MREQWKPVIDWEGVYEVSNLGGVRRILLSGLRVLKLSLDKRYGYMKADLRSQGKRKNAMVHRLVAKAFLGPVPVRHEVNHKNGIRKDNLLSNLEYVTRSQNLLHSFRVLGMPGRGPRSENSSTAKLTVKDVREVRLALRNGVSGRSLARQYRVSDSNMSAIKHRKTWVHVA